MPSKHRLLDSALGYLRRGWTIIPTKEKKAAVPWKRWQSDRPSEAQVKRWFASGRDVTGVAVILGSASGGLACRDFDAAAAYQAWAGAHADLAAVLPTVKTARGFHVYCRTAEMYTDLGDGEFRADARHYCLLPPSRHPTGAVYRWLVPLGDDLPFVDPVEGGFLPPSTPLPSPLSCPELSVSSVSSVSSVLHNDTDDATDSVIKQTLPTRQGERARRLFDLARGLKSIPKYADADPQALEPILKRWHALALPVIRTKPFEESLIDFLKSWPKVKFPAGTGPLDHLMRQAREGPLPAVALRYEQPELRLLVGLAALLQRASGQRPFFLSCRSAAAPLGVHYATVSRWLFLLVEHGVLQLVSQGDHATKKASEYRYLA